MPDRRAHRSAAPEDRDRLGPPALPRLRSAVQELSWLLGRGYAERSALALVGDRHELVARQRQAVARCALSDDVRDDLAARQVPTADLRGLTLVVDGFNLLVTLEAALAGGAVLLARDGCARDIAGCHGTWRRTEETRTAIEIVGRHLAEAGLARCTWILDLGVSNSGRLRGLLREASEEHGWGWEVERASDADARLVATDAVVASADREVLRRCASWTSLARELIAARVPDAWWVDLST